MLKFFKNLFSKSKIEPEPIEAEPDCGYKIDYDGEELVFENEDPEVQTVEANIYKDGILVRKGRKLAYFTEEQIEAMERARDEVFEEMRNKEAE